MVRGSCSLRGQQARASGSKNIMLITFNISQYLFTWDDSTTQDFSAMDQRAVRRVSSSVYSAQQNPQVFLVVSSNLSFSVITARKSHSVFNKCSQWLNKHVLTV